MTIASSKHRLQNSPDYYKIILPKCQKLCKYATRRMEDDHGHETQPPRQDQPPESKEKVTRHAQTGTQPTWKALLVFHLLAQLTFFCHLLVQVTG